MEHGKKNVFEIVGEQFIADGKIPIVGSGFRFGRLFDTLPMFQPLDSALDALGQSMTQATESPDSDIPSGYTYFGQFIDHDITLDDTSDLPSDLPKPGLPVDELIQRRSPSLDLDSVYGKPWPEVETSFLKTDGLQFRLEITTKIPVGAPGGPLLAEVDADVPRVAGAADPKDNGRAIIGDKRNDENLVIQQLHLAFLKFHNATARQLRLANPSESSAVLLLRTRELVTLHYQWIVLNDFVRRIVSPQIFQSVLGVPNLQGVTSVTPSTLIFPVIGSETPPMPLEFSAAAYRFGHSMVRDGYSWNKVFFDAAATPFQLFFDFTHLSGGIGDQVFGLPLPTFPSNWIADWRRMFEMETVQGFPSINRQAVPLNMARRLDPRLTKQLGLLPKGGGNLASRNLVRGSRVRLPSGQDVAKAIVAAGDPSAAPMSPAQILQGLPQQMQDALTAHELHIKTPLWFYILREAERAGGNHLGAVGSRIVMEVFFGLIRASVTSIFNSNPGAPGQLSVFAPGSSPLRTPGGEAITSMPHFLAFVNDVNRLGD